MDSIFAKNNHHVYPDLYHQKLEKLILRYITPNSGMGEEGILGKWNATVFYVKGSENWLLFNLKTNYSLILANITAQDLPHIQEKMCLELFLQMVSEGKDVTHEQIKDLIGEISFYATDADRNTLGHLSKTPTSIFPSSKL